MARVSDMKRLSKLKSQQSIEQEKAEYHEKYHKFKEEGKPFWPDVIFEDTLAIVVALGVLLVLIFLKGVPLGNVADPASREFVPRPEWYFLFLFQLLKYFPGAIEWVGVVVVPSAVILLLLLIPFIDRKKRPAKTGISVNVILKAGAVLSVFGVVFLTFKAYDTSPPTLEQQTAIRLTSQEQFGRNIFKDQGCLSCHVLAGEGSGVPLDGIGSRMSLDIIHNYVENPLSVNPNSTMPAFIKSLTHAEVEAVSRYLALFTAGGVTPRPLIATPRPETPAPLPATEPGTIPGTTETSSPASPAPAKSPPPQPANHTGRTACLACHEPGIAGAPKLPADHGGRNDAICGACHKAP